MTVRSQIGPFAVVPEWVFQHPRIRGGELAVYIALAMRADRSTGECWPSHQTIADDAGFKGISSVKRILTTLRECGAISWKRTQTSSIYTVHQVAPSDSSSAGYPETEPSSVSSFEVSDSSPAGYQIAHERAINHNQEPEPYITRVTAPSGAGAESSEITALDWDDSNESRAAVAMSLATRFYAHCRADGLKRPAVKHKAFVNLIDDLLERGYTSDEVWELMDAHHAGGFPWTLNSIAVTESRVRREQTNESFPEDWNDDDIAAYYEMKERRARGK